jgi:dihydropteroate synthase
MGVVNTTPDSFSDGGRFLDPEKAVAHGLRLLEEGADILDIGGESTRPGADPVSAEEEIRRTEPVVRGILARASGARVSIDTSKASVARAALEAGALVVNDVTAGRGDPDMLPLAADTGAGLALMHMRGTPRTMQETPVYDDVAAEVRAFLADRLRAAVDAGCAPEQVVLDPGIGFGKTLEHNLELMRHLSDLRVEGRPLLLGVSRKRWLAALTGRPVDRRLAASLAGLAACVARGAKIMRVHDVIESCDMVRVLDSIRISKVTSPP